MKNLSRSYIWWPNIDKQIEDMVNGCFECQKAKKMPNRASVHGNGHMLFGHIYTSFADYINGNYFLIVIDSYSKWMEVRLVPGPLATAVMKVLRELSATYGMFACRIM